MSYVNEINLKGDEINPKGSICIMIPPGDRSGLTQVHNIGIRVN
jgi:hypothetical protein